MVQSQYADSLTSDKGDTIANSTTPEGLTLEVVPFLVAGQYLNDSQECPRLYNF